MSPRALVVSYSRTGTTRAIADRIAAALDAAVDVDVIGEPGSRRGVLGYLRSGYQASFGATVDLAPAAHDPAGYDVVVIGTPIWNLSLSSPVRSYLLRYRDQLPAVAFFCTFGSRGSRRVFGQMAEVCGKQPIATLAVRVRARASATTARDIAELARTVTA